MGCHSGRGPSKVSGDSLPLPPLLLPQRPLTPSGYTPHVVSSVVTAVCQEAIQDQLASLSFSHSQTCPLLPLPPVAKLLLGTARPGCPGSSWPSGLGMEQLVACPRPPRARDVGGGLEGDRDLGASSPSWGGCASLGGRALHLQLSPGHPRWGSRGFGANLNR